MKFLKYLLIFLAVVFVFVVAFLIILMIPSVQRSLLATAIESQPGTQAQIGRIQVGWNEVTAKNVTVRQDGLEFAIDEMDLDVKYLSLLSDHIVIESAVLEGMRADLRNLEEYLASRPPQPEEPREQQPFEGVFPMLEAFPKLTLQDLRMSGEALLPEGRTASFTATGGGISPGETGAINLEATMGMPEDGLPLTGADVRKTVRITQGAEGITALDVEAVMTPQGEAIEPGTQLNMSVSLAQEEQGERYKVAMARSGAEGEILTLNALLNPGQGLIDYTYNLEATDNDLTALTGIEGPTASLQGQGKGELNIEAMTGDASGSLRAEASRLNQFLTNADNLRSASFAFNFNAQGDGEKVRFDVPALTATVNGSDVYNSRIGGTVQFAEGALGRVTYDQRETLLFNPLLEVFAAPDVRDGLVAQKPKYEAYTALSVEGDILTVQRMNAVISGDQAGRFLQVRLAPNLQINMQDPMKSLMDAGGEIANVSLKELPLALFSPFAPDMMIHSGKIGGTITVSSEEHVVLLESQEPVALANLTVSQAGERLLDRLSGQFALSGRYEAPAASFQLMDLSLSRPGAEGFVTGSAKGQFNMGEALTGEATVTLAADLPGALGLPMFAQMNNLASGRADVEARINMGDQTEVAADLAVANLAIAEPQTAFGSVALTADVTMQEDGSMRVGAPMIVNGPSGRSEVQFQGQLSPQGEVTRFEAELGGETVYASDLQLLASAFQQPGAEPAAKPEQPEEAPGPVTPDEQPLWAGFAGTASLAIDKVFYEDYEVDDVRGRVVVTEDRVQLSNISAMLAGEPFRFDATVLFTGGQTPYDLSADLDVERFDTGAFFKQVNPEQQPLVEAIVSVDGTIAGQGPSLTNVADWADAQLNFSGRQGVIRPLATTGLDQYLQGAGAAGQLLGRLAGDRPEAQYLDAAETLLNLLSEVRFDELSLNAVREAGEAIDLDSLRVLSDQLRLTGSGSIEARENVPFYKQPLDMQINLAAKGRVAQLLGKLNQIEEQADPTGYLEGPSYQLSGSLDNIKDSLARNLMQNLTSTGLGGLGSILDPNKEKAGESEDETTGEQVQGVLRGLQGVLGRPKKEEPKEQEEQPSEQRPSPGT